MPLYVLQRMCLSHLCGLFSDRHSQMFSLCQALSPEALQCLALPPDDSQCVATETRPQLATESTDLCTHGDNAINTKPTEYTSESYFLISYNWASLEQLCM